MRLAASEPEKGPGPAVRNESAVNSASVRTAERPGRRTRPPRRASGRLRSGRRSGDVALLARAARGGARSAVLFFRLLSSVAMRDPSSGQCLLQRVDHPRNDVDNVPRDAGKRRHQHGQAHQNADGKPDHQDVDLRHGMAQEIPSSKRRATSRPSRGRRLAVPGRTTGGPDRGGDRSPAAVTNASPSRKERNVSTSAESMAR